MAENEENPLLKALPPVTDYISYLTILEYNINADQLPVLHTILQDTTLTANIGWDLVHLLLPLLPASQQCLQDVARLGNPREVVLKVTELLENLGNIEKGGGSEAEEEEEEEQEEQEDTEAEISNATQNQAGDTVDEFHDGERFSKLQIQETIAKPPSSHLKFITLLEMLSILHPRIKTKYPSRFLSTSLQSILPVYQQIASEPSATEAVLNFIKTISGFSRPKLPPRKSSTAIRLMEKAQIAPDPEGQDDIPAPDESLLQNRLLQSFLTYVVEDFMTSIPMNEEIPGLAWSCRLHEKQNPAKRVPDRESYNEMFATDEELHERDTIMGQIVALARDLKIQTQELLSVVSGPEPEYREKDDELPSSATDVELSRIGSLYLLSAVAAASCLFDVPATTLPPARIFPDFAAILDRFIGQESFDSIGTEKPTMIDSVLFLGFYILSDSSGNPPPADDDVFKNLLQRLSLLSANTPIASLRYNAHLLTSTILHSHPSELVRLSFIQDTLEHCPYENLKASSVGWLKDELLAADRRTPEPNPKTPSTPTTSLFSSPSTLSTLSPFLFLNPLTLINPHPSPSPHPPTDDHPLIQAAFQAHHAFYLSVLNLYWLLLFSDSFFSSLAVKSLTESHHLREGFLNPLVEFIAAFRKRGGVGGAGGAGGEDGGAGRYEEEEKRRVLGEMDLLEGVLDGVLGVLGERGL